MGCPGPALYLAPHLARVQMMEPYKAVQRTLHQLALDSGDLAQSTRVGSFNAGILGFYQGGRVINLDGLMNADIAAHRATDSLLCYIRATGITHIQDLDFANVSDSYWRSCGDSGLELRGALREVRDVTQGGSRAVLYEIDWARLEGRGECGSPPGR